MNRNKQLEDQPDGTSRFCKNFVITKDGKVENEDGLIESTDIPYSRNIGNIIEVDRGTIVMFPKDGTKEVTVFEVGKATKTLEIPQFVDLSKRSHAIFKNYLKNRIIVYNDIDDNVRVLNIDNPLSTTGGADLDKLTKITPDLKTIKTTSVTRVDGGNLKTGKYFIAYGFEVEDRSPLKWTSPIGPYVIANYADDRFTSHVGDTASQSKLSLEIKFEPESDSYKKVNVAIISDIDGVRTASIISRHDLGTGLPEETIVYTGNETLDVITADEILVPKLHVVKGIAIASVRDALLIGGIESIDDSSLDQLQSVANDIEVRFESVELDTNTYEDEFNYRKDVTLDSLQGTGEHHSLMPDEVYAAYMNVQLIDGTERAFHIPGRVARMMTVTAVNGTTYIRSENGVIDDALLDYNDITKSFNYNDIPKGSKWFQLFNTAELIGTNNGGGDGYIGGYWENENERYPDHASFDQLRNMPVRHHRCPSLHHASTFTGNSFAFKVTPTFINVLIPTALKPLIAGIYFSMAKRTATNCLIAGMSPVIPHDSMFTSTAEGYDALFINGRQLRLYDYNLLTNHQSLSFDFIKTISYHNYRHPNSNPDVNLWNYSCKEKDEASEPNVAYDTYDSQFLKCYEKFFLPEGNAATEPPNIYTKDNEIVNREEAIFVSLDKGIPNRYMLFKDDNMHHNFLKQMAVLYNWNVNLYNNFAHLDTFAVSAITPDLDITKHVGTGGDVFPGNSYRKVTYQPEQGADIIDFTVYWKSFSPIMHQARVREITEGKDVSEKYNISCTPINDLHTTVIHGSDLKTPKITKYPYRFIKSQTVTSESLSFDVRKFLVNEYGIIPTNKGEITNIISQDNNILVQTPNTTWVYQLNDTLKADNLDVYLGRTDLFSVIAKELILSKLAIGGNKFNGSQLVCRFGIFFADAVSGEIFLVTKSITHLSRFGLSKDIQRILVTAKDVHFAFDDYHDRILVSIIGATVDDPTITLSYYPDQEGWCSEHSQRGVMPINLDGIIRYATVHDSAVGQRIFKHDALASNIDLVKYTGDRVTAQDDAYIDIVLPSPEAHPVKFDTIYFDSLCKSLLDFNNLYLADHTFDQLLVYTRNKCTGIVDIPKDIPRNNSYRTGKSISLKDGIWRFNSIKDMIVHYTTNRADNTDTGEPVDRPNFLNEETGVYDSTVLSKDAGGGRISLPYYDKDPIVDRYIVARFILKTDKKRKISISNIGLSISSVKS